MERLSHLGLNLPPPPQPKGSYVPLQRCGDLIFTAGQLCIDAHGVLVKGKLGNGTPDSLTIEQGRSAAELCMLNILSALKWGGIIWELAKPGDIQVIKLTGFVACLANFTDHPQVLNGASDLCLELFGEYGKHARSAVGVAALPLGAAVEVEGVFRLLK